MFNYAISCNFQLTNFIFYNFKKMGVTLGVSKLMTCTRPDFFLPGASLFSHQWTALSRAACFTSPAYNPRQIINPTMPCRLRYVFGHECRSFEGEWYGEQQGKNLVGWSYTVRGVLLRPGPAALAGGRLHDRSS